MPLRLALSLPLLLLAQACAPSLNWREVRLAGGELKALLPCKPDQASRHQKFGTQELELAMQGCEAGGGLYAVSVVELRDGAGAAAVQAAWERKLLEALQAGTPQHSSTTVSGAAAQQLQACGRRPDGRPVCVQALWFARGARLYHAALYAERIGADQREPFFTGLEFQ